MLRFSLPWPSWAGEEKPGTPRDVACCRAGRKLSNADSQAGTSRTHRDTAPQNTGNRHGAPPSGFHEPLDTCHRHSVTGTCPDPHRMTDPAPTGRGALPTWQTREVSHPLSPGAGVCLRTDPVSYTHLTLPTTGSLCRSRWSPYH